VIAHSRHHLSVSNITCRTTDCAGASPCLPATMLLSNPPIRERPPGLIHGLIGRLTHGLPPTLKSPGSCDIAAMLDTDPEVPATVILDHLRRKGHAGGITILKEHVAALRPAFRAARSFQRTTYFPGELAHGDWWEPGNRIPVGNGATRKAYGWVTTLPHCAAHAVVYSLSKGNDPS
jgi:hypothetical protein